MGSGMASEKDHPLRKKKKAVAAPVLTEQERIEEWRRTEFRRILGGDSPADDVETLVHSDADLRQAESMSDNGCPPDLIVKILGPLS